MTQTRKTFSDRFSGYATLPVYIKFNIKKNINQNKKIKKYKIILVKLPAALFPDKRKNLPIKQTLTDRLKLQFNNR